PAIAGSSELGGQCRVECLKVVTVQPHAAHRLRRGHDRISVWKLIHDGSPSAEHADPAPKREARGAAASPTEAIPGSAESGDFRVEVGMGERRGGRVTGLVPPR